MDKKALQEQFEEFARWYVLPLDKSEDGNYRALETQSAWMSFRHQQAKVEELQRRNQMLNDNIKEQGQKLVYQNEVIETQAEKLLGLRDEKAELQKQIDALEKSYFVLARIKSIASKNLLESILIKEVRQALKGEGQ